ncbi:MAG: hypothetical protein IT234_03940, partial [Bacteroidia bacterium]|nr:hypothetical protein [Bacteroidia bacterium]
MTAFFLVVFSYAQNKVDQAKYQIRWDGLREEKYLDTDFMRLLSFEGAQYAFEDAFLPRYFQKVAISSDVDQFSVAIVNAKYELLSDNESVAIKDASKIKESISIRSNILRSKGNKSGVVSFIPLRKNPASGQIEKLISFDLQIIPQNAMRSASRANSYVSNSVLKTGDWYKVAITSDGVYKIDRTFLENLGLDVDNLDPRNIRIYGNGGVMLPELNSAPHADDLKENAIYVQGESDGVFNTSDYVLFYGKATVGWEHDSTTSCPEFQHAEHLYADSAFYFLTVDLGPGKRIQDVASSSASPTHVVSSFDDYAFHENDN